MLTLKDLQRLFPRSHDAASRSDLQRWIDEYFASVERADDASSPFLGASDFRTLDVIDKFPTVGRSADVGAELLMGLMNYGVNWNHPTNAIAASAPSTSLAMLASVICSHLNPNLSHGSYGGLFSDAERRLGKLMCDLVGYDDKAVGYACYGAAGSIFYGVRAGVERALLSSPGVGRDKVRIFKGAGSHKSPVKAAAWLGLDPDAIVLVNAVGARLDPLDLLTKMREAVRAGFLIGCVIAEAGSTYEFAIDDVTAIADACGTVKNEFGLDYVPYLHVDAAVAGIYAVFNNYDVIENPLALSEEALGAVRVIAPALACINDADSIGVDFHKLGFCPLGSALHLLKDRTTLECFVRDGVGRAEEIWPDALDEFDAAAFTIESTRSAAGVVAALSNVIVLGRQGYQRLLGHSLELGMRFRALLADMPFCRVLNEDAPGPAVVFRVYPEESADDQMVGSEADALTEKVFSILRNIEGAMSMSLLRRYRSGDGDAEDGVPVSVIKGYFISPETTHEDVTRGAEALRRAYGNASASA